ncbi:alpha/beta hydrolase [Blastomonas sp. UPD001]|uniref:alpha/beta hydrolase n=1 Tax=Blastomonas sp. UPD001 TaxID=2217673 RepID=UPI000E34C670|nr:alpha/beta hydrolase [Blastomonas sp. UPD001]
MEPENPPTACWGRGTARAAGPDRAYRLASFWGADHVDAGRAGHINADSDLGDWPFGQRLLARLLDVAELSGEAGRHAPAPLRRLAADWRPDLTE